MNKAIILIALLALISCNNKFEKKQNIKEGSGMIYMRTNYVLALYGSSYSPQQVKGRQWKSCSSEDAIEIKNELVAGKDFIQDDPGYFKSTIEAPKGVYNIVCEGEKIDRLSDTKVPIIASYVLVVRDDPDF